MINKRIIADLHTHNHFSFDSRAIPSRCFSAAARAGIDFIAVTNHFDIDGVSDGIYQGYDAAADLLSIEQARQKHGGSLRIIRGIELGQPHHRPVEAQKFLAENEFDYVLLSLHNLRGVPDFYYWNFRKINTVMCEYWLDIYFDQILEMLNFPGGDALAHLNYPYRFMKIAGTKIDFRKYSEKLIKIFYRLIEKGMALEINTSGYRQLMDAPMPGASIIKLYRECGGVLNVVGSDAHKTGDIGADIERTYCLLKSLGFKHTHIPVREGFEEIVL